MNLVDLSKELALKHFEKNQAPPLLLIELAVDKGRELAKKYDADEELVVVSLYLAHTVFDKIFGGEIQRNHPELSASFVEGYLDKWKVDKETKEIILNAILAHHDKVEMKSKVAEIMKNAECYKFISLEGSLIYLHTLGLRGESYEEAVKKVLIKFEQKEKLLTLDECKKEVLENKKEIFKLFNF